MKQSAAHTLHGREPCYALVHGAGNGIRTRDSDLGKVVLYR